ncbi:hypothetical protein ACWCQL_08385 [Streptomyces sp. NPDC002073]
MLISTCARHRRAAAAVLLLSAALSLTGCGTHRAADARAEAAPGTPRGSASASAAPGASPYVEPGAGDGAPHYRENNAYRRSGEMAPADEEEARRQADRIEPVLKRLWGEKKWDPASVRAAVLALGYEERRVTPKGELLGGTLDVRAMDLRWETDHYVTPEGAQIGLYVGDSACVTAFVQKTNYEVKTNGPFPETGCLEPPYGH